MPLTPAAAAKRWLELKPQVGPLVRELEKCEAVLKERLAEGGIYRGVKCSVTDVDRLDTETAKALLAEAGITPPMLTSKRRSLAAVD